MQEVIDYLKANPKTSTVALQRRFGLSKGRAFSLRKEIGLVTEHIPSDLKQKVVAFLEANPTARPFEIQRRFGLTAMVVRRLRSKLGLIGTTSDNRRRRDTQIREAVLANPARRCILVAADFSVSTDIVERIRREAGLPRQTCLRESRERSALREEVGLVRREDRPAESGVRSPVPVDERKERWKRIDDSRYSVSTFGRVRNDETGLIMAQYQNLRGYWIINLYFAGKRYVKRTHRLVAEAFIPNPEERPEVNHKDGDTSNPRKSNLEWVTKAENMEHASREGLFTVAKISPGTAKTICASLSRRKAEGKSLRQVAEAHGVPVTLVERISARKTWTSISCEYEW